jgi:hypothetical protein
VGGVLSATFSLVEIRCTFTLKGSFPTVPHSVASLLSLFEVLSRIISYTLSSLPQQVVAQFLAWLYHVHWTIYLPICLASYYVLGLGQTIRTFIISSVTDEIFFYGSFYCLYSLARTLSL